MASNMSKVFRVVIVAALVYQLVSILVVKKIFSKEHFPDNNTRQSVLIRHEIHHVTTEENKQPSLHNDKSRIIVLWNMYWELKQASMTRVECEYNDCVFTRNRSLLDKASAVVIDIKATMEPFPQRARLDQLFVYFEIEPPPVTNEYYRSMYSRKHRQEYNLTMTYRSDSDIFIPYGQCIPLAEKHLQPYKQREPFVNKTRNVAWIVSHCSTDSKREIYVQNLSKFIDVDIYGKCGNLTCGKLEKHKCLSHYKFYLAFENTVCDDYVSEKYFRTLGDDMIPIVYGGIDYSKIGPSDSFINIFDYESPEALAQYLKYLAGNETAYLEYFRYKPYWKIVGLPDTMTRGFCKLCEIIQTGGIQKRYEDVHHWWVQDRCRVESIQRVVNISKNYS